MFTKKQLTNPDDLARFRALYEEASFGVGIDPAYLRRAKQVTVLFDTDNPDTYLGGYIINDQPPHRYFTAPGESARDEALAPLHLQENDLVEIGAIWFGRYRSALREVHRLLFFRAMLRDALQTGMPHILGGSFIPQVQRLQRKVLPALIFEKPITVGRFTGTLQLYVGPREGIWWRFFRTAVSDVFQRLRGRSQSAKRK